ncbi:MAG TPA: T9SS type A sorting domain-containing protein [Bacteroidia bacterium]|nr:T9SS type A sorting domain-containing protein [Bacteroidia bacterium]
MKNILTLSFLSAVCLLQAQTSIQLTDYGNSTIVSPNSAILVDVNASTTVNYTVDVKNTSNVTKQYWIKRYDVVLNPGADAYFCFASYCYGPPTIYSPHAITLTAGQSASQLGITNFQMLVMDLTEPATSGYSHIKYTVFDSINPNDSVQFSMKYNSIVHTNISYNYGFGSVTISSGTLDPTPSSTVGGLNLGHFSAVGTFTNPSVPGSFAYAGWPQGASNGNDNQSSMTGSLNTGKYFEVSVTPQPGYSLTLLSSSFDVNRAANGPRNYAVRSSVHNYSTNLTGVLNTNTTNLSLNGNNEFFWKLDANFNSPQSGSNLLLNVPAFAFLANTTTFRFYSWNAEADSGWFAIDNVQFFGTVSSLVTGLGQVSMDMYSPISIYPSPSSGLIYVKGPARFERVDILNAQGAILYSTKTEQGAGLEQFEMDLGFLPSGVYIIRMQSGERYSSSKFILSK